jgi:uncharacterized DUF497 family protein
MKFSWDPDKRLRTIADRGLDFVRARQFFDGRRAVHQPSPRNDEDRWKTTTELDGGFYTVVWIWRGGTRHIISMRRAHAQEIRKYRELHGR